jgi:hypothetical protein
VLAEDPNFAIRFIAQAAPIAASTSPNARRHGHGRLRGNARTLSATAAAGTLRGFAHMAPALLRW